MSARLKSSVDDKVTDMFIFSDSFARKWRFSECSLLYFDFFIDHLNENKTNCLTRGSSKLEWKGSTLDVEDGVGVYTPDEQCERRHGQGYVLDRVWGD